MYKSSIYYSTLSKVGALALDQSIQQEWALLGLESLPVEIGFVFDRL